ncbi:MAG: MFS transporter [Proteobacteria bacterium]|nr:MFS transporter [Pseudomonadota bacterium]
MGLPSAQPTPTAIAGARYALGLLLVVYVFNHIDRQIMNILIEPVRIELQATDAQMGLLVGVAFALFYTFAGLPVARWADRGSRRTLISLALAVWSALTAACGLARNYFELLLARIGVGIGEAGCTPPAHSLISDYFPAERRATALSFYQVGVPIGTLLGMAFGGWMADTLGWRLAFMVVGLPGLLLAVVVRTTLREPRRGQADAPTTDVSVQPVPEVLRFLWRMHSLRHALVATAVQTLALAAQASWHAPFLMRVYGLSATQAGFALGLIAGAPGGISTFAGGWLGDRLGLRDLRWYLWLPALGAVASIPFSLLAYTAESAPAAIAFLVAATLFNHLYSGLGHAVAQSLVKPRMRAVMSAVALFMMNLVGFGLGPWLAGIASDAFRPVYGEESIRYALLVFTAALVWAGLHYLRAARTYRADLDAKNR